MKITIRENGWSPKIAKRELNNINKGTMQDVGEYWHNHFREKHFTTAGAREYGYAPRARGYMIAKAKKKGHQLPLVWTGVSRLRSMFPRIVATASKANAKVRIVLNMPQLNRIPRLREEMERVSQRELSILGNVVVESQERRHSALKDTSVTTIGS